MAENTDTLNQAGTGGGNQVTSRTRTKEDEDLIADLRTEAANRRHKAKELKEELDRIAAEKEGVKTELQKKLEDETAKSAAAIGKFKDKAVAAELKALAIDAGASRDDLDDIIHLIRHKYSDKIKINDDGDVDGLSEAVDEFKKSKPNWFGKKSDDAGAGKGDDTKRGATGSGKNPSADGDVKPVDLRDREKVDYKTYALKKQQMLKSLRGK